MALSAAFVSDAQSGNARDIVKRSEDQLRGKTSVAVLSIDIVRPGWTRTMKIKAWMKGEDFSMILLTAPVRDQGTVFLKRKKEVWNWLPSVERTIKLPPSMMTQSWMGTDFTNDDLVRESSVLQDYTHSIAGDSLIQGRRCWKIEMIPLPETAVVWGQVNLWIDQQDYLQLRAEFRDEEKQLVNVMECSVIRSMGGRILPTVMEMKPADKPGNKTILRYESIVFDQSISDEFFTTQNMKKVR